jgi:protocatechuate 3,4-dioxygenase beta subunit
VSADAPVAAEVVALLDGCVTTCQLIAEQEEGPYRRGEQPRRRDITEGRPGSSLVVGLSLRTAAGATIDGADVEVWHCDAEGRYSGYPPNDPNAAVDPAPQSAEYLTGETFLRGRQTTDAAGIVEFRTIYPGWYPGRAVHIHLTVHAATRIFTTQLYFPEDVTAEVFALDPYRPHGLPETTHAADGIFSTGGQPAVLDMRAADGGLVGVLCLVIPNDEDA